MPIDIEKLQEYTGIKADTTEDFIAQFPKRFIPADMKHWDEETKNGIFGRTTGSIAIGIKQNFDEFGISITGDDLKNTPEAVNKLGLQRLADKFALEKAELEKTAGLSADEKIKEAQETINKLTGKAKDLEKLVKSKADEFEQLNQTKAQELKKFKVNSVYKDVQSDIPWNPDKDEFSRKGFLATMNEKFAIDLDETDTPFIVDRSTNSRIKAEGSHSTFMTPSEVYKQEAIKSGLAAINKKVGQAPVTRTQTLPITTTQTNSPITGRKVMANTRFVKE